MPDLRRGIAAQTGRPICATVSGMDNVQRIYRQSEKRHIPARPCPDCGTPIRGHWKEHPGFVVDLDPQGSITWRCFGQQCLTGKESF